MATTMHRTDGPLFSLILPVYAPGAALQRTWDELMRFVGAQRRRWEILFVCDGCPEGSETRLAAWARECPHAVRVVRSATNRGKGHAVRRGLLRARGDYRIFTDVDLAYPLEMIETMAEQLEAGADVMIASRAHRESEVTHAEGLADYVEKRNRQSRLFSMAVRTILGITNRDPQAGLKGFSARVVRAVLPHVKCQGFGFDCELLVACRYFGIRVREMPVRVRYDARQTTTRLTTARTMLNELLAIRLRWKKIGKVGLDQSIFVSADALREAREYRNRRRKQMARLAPE